MTSSIYPAWWQRGMRYRANGSVEWRFYVKIPGGTKQVSAYGKGIKELKAERKRIEQLYECAPERIRLNELLDRYLENKRNEDIDARKIADMESRFERLVRPKLGRHDVAVLCANWNIIGEHFRALSKKQPNNYVIQRVFDEMKRAFKFAESRQWCTLNPLAKLERPPYTPSEVREPFTIEQVYSLIGNATGRDKVMICFLVMTGVRTWSEMSGLRVRDLNLLQRSVALSTFVRRDEKGRPEEKPTVNGKQVGKTKRAARVVPLIEPLAAILEQYLCSAHLGPNDYLFPNASGGLLRGGNWTRRHWKPLVTAIGKPKAVPYELRHTASSLLADLGVDAETRAEICGHSEAVNRSIYTKMSLEAKRAAMDKLGPLFPGLAASDKGQDEGTGAVETAA